MGAVVTIGGEHFQCVVDVAFGLLGNAVWPDRELR